VTNVTNTGKIVAAAQVDSGTLNNSGILSSVTTAAAGIFTNQALGAVGDVTNAGTGSYNLGLITGSLINTGGTFSNGGTINVNVEQSGGTVTNHGDVNGALNLSSGTFNQGASGEVFGLSTISGDGILNNGGTLADVSITSANGIFDNKINGVAGNVTNAGTFINRGGAEAGNVNNAKTFYNLFDAVADDVINTGFGSNAGTIASLANSGAGFFINASTGEITGNVIQSGGTIINNGDVLGTLNLSNSLFDQNTGGSVALLSTISNGGVVTNAGTFAM
jgi:fibronectin-binding autotransporter adhesin